MVGSANGYFKFQPEVWRWTAGSSTRIDAYRYVTSVDQEVVARRLVKFTSVIPTTL